ncbi:hypothetical protein EU545_04665 [Candidatus Thorarchaeota archaeon]|jgi:sulfur carrier protein ThiS|nr:MAG: hypothetical protein EU545_04665 [Candidatus Thorarchaeota archaeon]
MSASSLGEAMSEIIRKQMIRRVIVEEAKTVAELLAELEISMDHIVLVDGKKVSSDFVLRMEDNVVVLPKIAGG